MDKKYSIILLIAIIILAVVAGFFVYPKWLGAKFLPWRLGLDLVGGAQLIYEVDMSQVNSQDRDSVMSGLKNVIEERVNLYGVSEPQVISAKEGDSYRLIVELAGIKDIGAAINEIGLTPLLDFREVLANEKDQTIEFVPTNLTGRYVQGAQLDFDSTTRAPQVNIQFNDEGAKFFTDLTAQNVGKPLAIFLDNKLIEMPIVREKISGGRAQITGQFTVDEAKKLVERFNAGALPAPINLISQQTIGASLGQESLNKAIFAGAIGIFIIILFMIGYYRQLGIFASLALLIYVFGYIEFAIRATIVIY